MPGFYKQKWIWHDLIVAILDHASDSPSRLLPADSKTPWPPLAMASPSHIAQTAICVPLCHLSYLAISSIQHDSTWLPISQLSISVADLLEKRIEASKFGRESLWKSVAQAGTKSCRSDMENHGKPKGRPNLSKPGCILFKAQTCRHDSHGAGASKSAQLHPKQHEPWWAGLAAFLKCYHQTPEPILHVSPLLGYRHSACAE